MRYEDADSSPRTYPDPVTGTTVPAPAQSPEEPAPPHGETVAMEEPGPTEEARQEEEPSLTDEARQEEEPSLTDEERQEEEPSLTDEARQEEEPGLTEEPGPTEEPATAGGAAEQPSDVDDLADAATASAEEMAAPADRYDEPEHRLAEESPTEERPAEEPGYGLTEGVDTVPAVPAVAAMPGPVPAMVAVPEVAEAERAGEPERAGEVEPERQPEPEPVDTQAEAPTELMPGDVPAASIAALWSADTVDGFRSRWREVQLHFVDDPRGAATEAQSLVAEVIDALSTTVAAQKSDLDGWASAEGGDTEELRMAVRRYRDFMDRVLGL